MRRAVRVKIGALAVEGLPASEAADFRRALENELRRHLGGNRGAAGAPAAGTAATLARRAAAAIAARLPGEVRKP
jgi:hypothetical protein